MDELEEGVRAALSPVMDQVVLIQNVGVGSGFVVYVGDNDIAALQEQVDGLMDKAEFPEHVDVTVVSGSGPTV